MVGTIELDLLDVGDGLLGLGAIEGDRDGTTTPAASDRVGLNQVDAVTVGRDGTVAGIDLDSDFFSGAFVIFDGAFVVVGESRNADFLKASTAMDVLSAASLNCTVNRSSSSPPAKVPWPPQASTTLSH